MHLIQGTMTPGSPHPRSVLTLANRWWPASRPLLDAQHPFRKSAVLCVEPTRANSCYLASTDTFLANIKPISSQGSGDTAHRQWTCTETSLFFSCFSGCQAPSRSASLAPNVITGKKPMLRRRRIYPNTENIKVTREPGRD